MSATAKATSRNAKKPASRARKDSKKPSTTRKKRAVVHQASTVASTFDRTAFRKLRAEKKLSQAKIASLVGLSPSRISEMEGRGLAPTPETIKKLAKALGISDDGQRKAPQFDDERILVTAS